VKRVEKVRLYPSAAQAKRLRHILHILRQLYNALLQERRDAYRMRGISLTAKVQSAELTDLRACDPRIAAVYRETEDALVHRVDLGMAGFFRRLARGETPGYPRFKSASRFAQIQFPHGDRALKFDADQTRVRVPGVGNVRLRKGRGVPPFRRAWLVCKNERWYGCFECERDALDLPRTGKVIGIDRGVHVLAATSEGHLHANGRPAERHRRVVTRHQRELAEATVRDAAGCCLNRHDPQRQRAVRTLALSREREANARRDALHKLARTLVAGADVLVLEKLAVRSMTRSARGTLERPGRNVRAKAGLSGPSRCGVWFTSSADRCQSGRGWESDRRGGREIFVAGVLALRVRSGEEPSKKALWVRQVWFSMPCGCERSVGDSGVSAVRRSE